MSETYKNGLLKKNLCRSPKIRIFEEIRTKIRTCTDKSVQMGTLSTTQTNFTVLVAIKGIFLVFFRCFHLE